MMKRVTIYSRLSQFANVKVPVETVVMINENGDTEVFTVRPLQFAPRRP